jgi:hypothetical protein
MPMHKLRQTSTPQLTDYTLNWKILDEEDALGDLLKIWQPTQESEDKTVLAINFQNLIPIHTNAE